MGEKKEAAEKEVADFEIACEEFVNLFERCGHWGRDMDNKNSEAKEFYNTISYFGLSHTEYFFLEERTMKDQLEKVLGMNKRLNKVLEKRKEIERLSQLLPKPDSPPMCATVEFFSEKEANQLVNMISQFVDIECGWQDGNNIVQIIFSYVRDTLVTKELEGWWFNSRKQFVRVNEFCAEYEPYGSYKHYFEDRGDCYQLGQWQLPKKQK